MTNLIDANLFKEAFIKAQQENEVLFSKSAAAAEEPVTDWAAASAPAGGIDPTLATEGGA